MPSKIKKYSFRKALKEVQKDLTKKVGLFDKMGDECSSCGIPFDKTDIEMVREWHVVVKKEPEAVRLYCPDCWNAATNVVENFNERIQERFNEDS